MRRLIVLAFILPSLAGDDPCGCPPCGETGDIGGRTTGTEDPVVTSFTPTCEGEDFKIGAEVQGAVEKASFSMYSEIPGAFEVHDFREIEVMGDDPVVSVLSMELAAQREYVNGSSTTFMCTSFAGTLQYLLLVTDTEGRTACVRSGANEGEAFLNDCETVMPSPIPPLDTLPAFETPSSIVVPS